MYWEDTLRRIGHGVVVNKGVSVKYDGIRLPRFISEYLLSEFILRYDDHEEAIRQMSTFIDAHIPQPGDKSHWHHRLKQGDRIEVIDSIGVSIHMEKDSEVTVRIPSIDVRKARVSDDLVTQHPRLLRGNVWGKASLEYKDGDIWLSNFKPFQVSDISFKSYLNIRQEFSTSEWAEILVSTIGLNPMDFSDPRKRLILISRLLPLVQGQTYLIEMGPPGTGKTFVLDKLSTRSFVVSGSKISPAQLFYDIKSKTEGVLRQYAALLLDEVDKVQDKELSEEVVNKLLKYMESGTFDRGGLEFHSDTSIILAGNLPPGGHGKGAVIRTMPTKLTHEAFLDRINGILPGWELSPVMHSSSSLTKTWGFSADYFSEILEFLRQKDWIPEFKQRIIFDGCSIRDEKAIMRTVCGLAKLLHPNKALPDSELSELLEFAVGIRQNLIDEGVIFHGTRPRRIAAFVRSVY